MPAARFFFDAGSGTALWAATKEDREQRGYAVDLRRLPVSQALRGELESLIIRYDSSLNRDYPPDPGPWREPQCREFNRAVSLTRRRSPVTAADVRHDQTDPRHGSGWCV
jgi:hypothetical protein